ncbi:TolB family protein [Aquimarina algiphila]|nr:DPP IV N-terminal domain-containing protein [Aquimarina algiphila]
MKQLVLGCLCILSFYNSQFENHTSEDKIFCVDKISVSSKILFSKKDKSYSGWSIYMMNPDGSDKKVLIPFKSGMGEYNAEISPNGKTILFNTYRYGGWKLATHNIENNTTKRISPNSNYYTNGVYSPNGEMIAYEKNVQRSTHIFIADKHGNNEKMLTGTMGNENRIPSWSSDGESIVFYSEKNRVNDIYQVTIKDNQITNLTNNLSGNDFAPAVSPDGKKIAFFSDRNGYLDLYVMDSTGANQKNITANLQNKNNTYNYYKDSNLYWIVKTSWSPDGQELVFSNITNDNFDVFTIAKNGSNLKQITETPESEYTPVWGAIQ